jgi:hypothetical protein
MPQGFGGQLGGGQLGGLSVNALSAMSPDKGLSSAVIAGLPDGGVQQLAGAAALQQRGGY